MKYYRVKRHKSYVYCWSIYDCKPGDKVRINITDGPVYAFGNVEQELGVHDVEEPMYPILSNETALYAVLNKAKFARNQKEALRKLIIHKLTEDDFKIVLDTIYEQVPETQFLIDQYIKNTE